MTSALRRTISVLLILCCLSTALPALSEAPTLIRRSVRVGFFQFDGYHMMDENGLRSGYGYDLIQMMGRYNDWQCAYIGYDQGWSDMQQMLLDGQIDMVTSARKTPEREALFDFSDQSIGSSSTILTVREGDSRFSPGDYMSLDGIRVGLLRNNSRNQSFAAFAEEKGFTYTPVEFDTADELEAALKTSKTVDAIVTSNMRTVSGEWVLEQFDASPIYVIVRKGSTSLLKEIDYAISQMDEFSPGWRDTLSSRYYAARTGTAIAFSVPEQAYLKEIKSQQRVFTVLTSPDRAPYSWLENGEMKGILPEMFELLCQRVGLNCTLLTVESRADYNEILSSGTADVVLDMAFNYSWAEQRGLQLTDSYMTCGLSALRLREEKEATGLLAVPGALLPGLAASVFSQEGTAIPYDDMQACLDAVESGQADVAVLLDYSAQRMVEQDVRNHLTASLLPGVTVSLSIGVNTAIDHRLLSILNKGVSSVTGAGLPTIILEQTRRQQGEYSLMAFLYNQPIAVLLLTVTLLGLIFGVCVLLYRAAASRRLKAQAAELNRYMGYVVKTNDRVLEVDLSTMRARRLYMENGEVRTSTEPFLFHDFNNAGNAFDPRDFKSITDKLNIASMDELIARCSETYFEARVKDEHGAYRWYSYSLQAIPRDKNHPKNFVLFKKDIDDVKRSELQQRQNLQDALETARHASEAKGAFLSRMSHEIRTPLNAVIGYMTIARTSENDPEKVRHCLDSSEVAARQLLGIINDVLDISSIESGRMKIAHEDFDLRQLLTGITTVFYNQCHQKGIIFSTRLKSMDREMLMGDPLRLNQILMNLLSNAVKFTPADGSVTLSVQETPVNAKILLRIEVKDTGCGMSEAYKARMFQPFEQESAATANRYGGTGLGLSITNNLVNMMGGSIDVDSRQNVGTTFTVTLPFDLSDKTSTASITQDFSKLRVLVVDDEQDTCDYVKALLKRCGIRSDTVTSGEDALRQLKRRKATDYAYDLCIIDWNMQGMDGISCARRIHEELNPDLLIIIATAYDTTAFMEEARAAGVKQVISKPLFQSTMFDLLVSTFGKYSPKGNAASMSTAADELKGMHVLLAEDNPMNMEIAAEMLSRAGLAVTRAADGQEALDTFLASAPGTYQVILMDVQMPRMNGYQAAIAIRHAHHPEAKTMPIIAMTANAFTEDVAEALASGMDDHIAKPIDYVKLFEAMQRLTKKGKAE